jgi:tRNA threonylcarbamoyladenosine biosynthesis protein TsaB
VEYAVPAARERGFEEVRHPVGLPGARRTVHFRGRLLAKWRQSADNLVRSVRVYQTERGQFAVYQSLQPDWSSWEDDWDHYPWPDSHLRERRLDVYPDLGALGRTIPAEFLAAVEAAASGQTDEYLDICRLAAERGLGARATPERPSDGAGPARDATMPSLPTSSGRAASVLVLAMDTATPTTSVALGSDDGALAAVAVRHERRHAELLAPAVRWVLEQAEVDAGSLAGLAVGIGPGLFTGLRVGVSTAKALAQAWKLPMVAVPSLDLVAFAHRHARRTICAVIDARRQEVFTALYRAAPGGVVRLTDYQVLRPDQLVAGIEARGEDLLLCGDGAHAYRAAFERLGEQVQLGARSEAAPSAAALVELALPRFHREQSTRPLDVTPLYLRRPDIDPSVERRLAAERAGG